MRVRRQPHERARGRRDCARPPDQADRPRQRRSRRANACPAAPGLAGERLGQQRRPRTGEDERNDRLARGGLDGDSRHDARAREGVLQELPDRGARGRHHERHRAQRRRRQRRGRGVIAGWQDEQQLLRPSASTTSSSRGAGRWTSPSSAAPSATRRLALALDSATAIRTVSAGWARLGAGELGERVDRERRERGDLERPGAQLGDLAHGAARVLEREERLARRPDQRAPRIGQREAAPDPVEELARRARVRTRGWPVRATAGRRAAARPPP